MESKMAALRVRKVLGLAALEYTELLTISTNQIAHVGMD